LSVNLKSVSDAPIIELDIIDSTNNYAMRLIDADTAQPGLTITANRQTQGKGQRGKKWEDTGGQSLLMSIIATPIVGIEQQFTFNAGIAVAIADVLLSLYENWDVRIKWPNDIIINDKKAGGLLIENVIRGSEWTYAVIGLGLNILQDRFPPELPYAGSLKTQSGKVFQISNVFNALRGQILNAVYDQADPSELLDKYNSYLYRKDELQTFSNGEKEWKGRIIAVTRQGQLMVKLENDEAATYTHGTVNWVWE
jgi:BirA family biotin operon repressor/biotin-[acetyl-CoA-carboxylase] ligase